MEECIVQGWPWWAMGAAYVIGGVVGAAVALLWAGRAIGYMERQEDSWCVRGRPDDDR